MLSYFCYPPAPFYLHFRSWPTYIPRFTLTIIQSLLWKTQYPISLSAFIITAKITQPSIISVTAPQQLQRVMQMGRKTAETNHHKLVGLKYNRKVCVCVCVCARAGARMHSLSHVRFFVTSWAVTLPGGLCLWNLPGKYTGVGCLFLLQGIFLTQGSSWYLRCLLNWQADSLPLCRRGSPHNRKLLSHKSGRQKSEIIIINWNQSVVRTILPQRLWRRMCSLTLPASGECWQYLPCGCIISVSSFMVPLPPPFLCKSIIFIFCMYKDTCHDI